MQNSFFESLLNASLDGILAFDRECRYTAWNSAMERISGLPKEEVLGRYAFDLFPFLKETGEDKFFFEALSGRSVIAEDRPYAVPETGQRGFFNGYYSPLYGASGEVIGGVAIIRDITERRRAEEALRKQQEDYQTILNSVPAIIWYKDTKNRHLRCNQRAAEFIGLRVEEVEGTSAWDLFPPEKANQFYAEDLEVIHSGQPKLGIIEQVKTPSGDDRWHQTDKIPYFDQEGKITGVIIFSLDITERKRAEEALRESEARFQRLVELSPDAIVVHCGGKIVFINTAGAKLLSATSPEQIIGRSVMDFVHPDFHETVGQRLQQMKEGQTVPPIEMKFIRLDGAEVYGEVVSVPFTYQDEPAVQVVVRDLTWRKRTEQERAELLAREQEARAVAEEALRLQQQVEERLRMLIDASQSLLSSLELTAVLPAILSLSRRLISADAYAIWRFRPAEKRWEVVAADGLSEEYQSAFINVTTDTPSMPDRPLVMEDVYGYPLVAERAELYQKEGIRSLLSMPLRIRGEIAGTLVFYYRQGHYFDSTEISVATALTNLAASAISTAELYEEQKRLRVEAEASERRAAFLAEAATVLSSSLDYEATLQSVAHLAVPHVAEWCAVDILDEDQTIRRLAVAHVEPKKVEWARELQRRYPPDPSAPRGVPAVLRTGKSELYPEITDELLVASARDAEHLQILREIGVTSAMIVPLIARGRVFGAITFVTAESGRRYGSADLSFAEDLARRAALSVDNAWLYRKMQEANRLKDEFLATVSHELRTPLTAIIGWTHLLLSQQMDGAASVHGLEVIARQARAQSQLIEDLLDVSRIIAGKLRLNVHPIDLTSVIEAAVESIRPAAEAKAIRLEVVLDQQAGPISGDADRLRQVVWNLLSNAVKFTSTGGHVQVRLAHEGAHAEITVSDTGKGIEPEFLPFVFDRFRQADMGYTRKHGGLGLGLAIARHLMELHGGTIEAASAGEEKGATFTVKLPLMSVCPEPSLGEQVPLTVAGMTSSKPEPLDGIRVLVVDDEPDTLGLLKMILEQRGASVTTAGSAVEALEALEREEPDILVSDIGMPGTDGFELIRRVRMLPADRGGAVPAAALTAYARVEDRLRALSEGYQMHVVKPVEPEELVAIVASLASGKKQA